MMVKAVRRHPVLDTFSIILFWCEETTALKMCSKPWFGPFKLASFCPCHNPPPQIDTNCITPLGHFVITAELMLFPVWWEDLPFTFFTTGPSLPPPPPPDWRLSKICVTLQHWLLKISIKICWLGTFTCHCRMQMLPENIKRIYKLDAPTH